MCPNETTGTLRKGSRPVCDCVCLLLQDLLQSCVTRFKMTVLLIRNKVSKILLGCTATRGSRVEI